MRWMFSSQRKTDDNADQVAVFLLRLQEKNLQSDSCCIALSIFDQEKLWFFKNFTKKIVFKNDFNLKLMSSVLSPVSVSGC